MDSDKVLVVLIISFVVWNIVIDVSSNVEYISKNLFNIQNLIGSNSSTNSSEIASRVLTHSLKNQFIFFKRTTATFVTTSMTTLITFLPVSLKFNKNIYFINNIIRKKYFIF
jgi:hypothetical protein